MKIWFPAIRASSGADIYTERLASTLVKYGIDAEITWFPASYEFLPELMRRHAIPAGVDLIHANSWNAAVFIGLGFPVVTTVHHLVHDPAFRPYRSWFQSAYHMINVYSREKRAIEKCDAVISVSNYTASVVKDVFNRNSNIIWNWVDLDKYKPAQVQISNNKFTILIVGNMGKRKGSDLLSLLSEMLGNRFEVRVTGGLRNNSNAFSAANTVMLGPITEAQLITEYQNCDAVLSLSRYEGFGYTALEAMACGKPFVGFKTSGLIDVVANNETGILSEIDDVDALVASCNALATDSGKCIAFGANGLNRATKVFSEEHSIGMYIDVYSGIVSATR